MKKQLLTVVFLFPLICAYAQITTRTMSLGTTSVRSSIGEKTVVRDSAGIQYDYATWHKLQLTGDYSLRPAVPIKDGKPNNDPDMEYILVRTPPEIKEMLRNRKPPESPYFVTGQTIKPFKIRDIYDNKLDAKAWAGKTVVLNFWFVDCPPCKAEIPELNKISDKYANNSNVIFIGIALDNDSRIKNFIIANPFLYVLVPDGREYANLFGIKTYPTNVVVSKEGKVTFHTSGYGSNTARWIEKTVDESDNAVVPAK